MKVTVAASLVNPGDYIYTMISMHGSEWKFWIPIRVAATVTEETEHKSFYLDFYIGEKRLCLTCSAGAPVTIRREKSWRLPWRFFSGLRNRLLRP